MKKLVIAIAFAAVVATPALAADEQYVLVKDTVGNCAAVVSSGSQDYPGMTVVGKEGYPSIDAANKALDDVKVCKGLVR